MSYMENIPQIWINEDGQLEELSGSDQIIQDSEATIHEVTTKPDYFGDVVVPMTGLGLAMGAAVLYASKKKQ